MNCPHCRQPLEAGAAFCGNCGQPVSQVTGAPSQTPQTPPSSSGQPAGGSSPIAQVMQTQSASQSLSQPPNGPLVAVGSGPAGGGIPGYALALPGQHSGDIKALLALSFGIAGFVGALFMVLIGLALGIAGIVMGTMSRSSSKRALSTAGLIVSTLAVLANVAIWAWAANHVEKLKQTASSSNHNITAQAVSTSTLSTPCYSIDFVDKLNVANNANSCDMNAFNGPTLNTSTSIYKIYADTSQTANAGNFTAVAKPAIEKDIQTNLPGFGVDSERDTQFAGSTAYVVNASNQGQHVAVVEEGVFHQVGNGDNIFIMVHATAGDNTDLNLLEAQWQWK